MAAARGDWGSKSTTWSRTGAFGGYRALEPGDRVSAAVIQDLVLLSRGEAAVVPRVTQRLEEAAPTARILVNVGSSMRIPGGRRPPKVVLGAQVAELIAAEAWKQRSVTSVGVVGVARSDDAIEATALHPGGGEIERAVVGLARSAARLPEVPKALSGVGTVILISDFQLEALDGLAQWVVEAEAEGVRVGGVLLFSPAEYSMVETGVLAATRRFVDRADWSPTDVERAMLEHAEHVEALFEPTTGGLTVVHTRMDTNDLEVVLAERRLFEILR